MRKNLTLAPEHNALALRRQLGTLVPPKKRRLHRRTTKPMKLPLAKRVYAKLRNFVAHKNGNPLPKRAPPLAKPLYAQLHLLLQQPRPHVPPLVARKLVNYAAHKVVLRQKLTRAKQKQPQRLVYRQRTKRPAKAVPTGKRHPPLRTRRVRRIGTQKVVKPLQ